MSDKLTVTSVQIYDYRGDDPKVKAMSQITINDALFIRGLKIREGENGLFVAFPQDLDYETTSFRFLICPITKELREEIENRVIMTYKEDYGKTHQR